MERIERRLAGRDHSLVNSFPVPVQNMDRHRFTYELRDHDEEKAKSALLNDHYCYLKRPERTARRKEPPPHSLKIYKVLSYVLVHVNFFLQKCQAVAK